MAKKGRRATNEERLAAIQMYDNGLTVDRIAEILDVGRSSVFDWISKYREGGLDSISTKFTFGRAVEALERLKKFPGIVRGFFGDPKLAYVHA